MQVFGVPIVGYPGLDEHLYTSCFAMRLEGYVLVRRNNFISFQTQARSQAIYNKYRYGLRQSLWSHVGTEAHCAIGNNDLIVAHILCTILSGLWSITNPFSASAGSTVVNTVHNCYQNVLGFAFRGWRDGDVGMQSLYPPQWPDAPDFKWGSCLWESCYLIFWYNPCVPCGHIASWTGSISRWFCKYSGWQGNS